MIQNTKVSIGIVFTLVVQISGFVWWTAQQAQTIDDLEREVSALTARENIVDEVNVKRDIVQIKQEMLYVWEAIDDLDETLTEVSKSITD